MKTEVGVRGFFIFFFFFPPLKRDQPKSMEVEVEETSGKNSDFFHTHKGMKQTHKGMKNHCFSRKHVFHTLKHQNVTFGVCFIP